MCTVHRCSDTATLWGSHNTWPLTCYWAARWLRKYCMTKRAFQHLQRIAL